MTPTAPNRSSRGREAKTRSDRKSKQESFADWMNKIDASVDAAAREVAKNPPSYAYLHPAQRRIVQMLIEHMRSLPELGPNEDAFKKREYGPVNRILKELYLAKFPVWEHSPKMLTGHWDIGKIPCGEGATYELLLRNCAGRAPVETEDDD